MKSCALVFLVLFCPLFVLGQTSLCHVTSLELQWPNNAPIKLEDPSVSFSSTSRYSELELTISNGSKGAISQIAMLVELFDTSDAYLATIALHGESREQYQQIRNLPESLRVGYDIGLDSVLFPGESKQISALTSRIMPRCPSGARISFMRLDFVGSEPYVFRSNAIRTDAAPLTFTSSSSLEFPPVNADYQRMLFVRIDDKGQPYLTFIGDYPKGFPGWLTAFLNQWKFTPATFNDVSIGGEVSVLIRVHSTWSHPWPLEETYKREKGPFVAIDVFPARGKPAKFEVFYGGRPSPTPGG